jgi:hypothetical protein
VAALCLKVSAHGNHKPEDFNRQAAKRESGARSRVSGGKQDECRNCEKETGRHHKQTCELHVDSFLRLMALLDRLMRFNANRLNANIDPEGRWMLKSAGRGQPV